MYQVSEPVLIVEGAPAGEERILLQGKTVTLGRQAGNDVVVPEAGVSRKHAEVNDNNGVFHLRDLGSTNGTFVNQRKISADPYLLNDGDRITLGISKAVIVFRSPTANTLQITLMQDAPTQEPPAVDRTWIGEAVPNLEAFGADEVGPDLDVLPEEETYQGTVRLNIQARNSTALVVQFTQALGERPEFRILRLANNTHGGVEIWLGLRQPVPLRKMLMDMKGVAEVSAPSGRDLSPRSADAPLTVMLKLPGQ